MCPFVSVWSSPSKVQNQGLLKKVTMEVGKKLELSITADEVEVLSKAIKNEKFQEMLSNYFQEISSPENVKTYQEEVTLLEQKRGNSIEFIHPTPFRALETSVDGMQGCFINICACDKVGKPESRTVRTVDRFGEKWSLPHLLQPGRQNCERKGNISTIFDVCFHPETLHLADKNEKFMDMVKEVAIQGIQKAFKVLLDKSNLKEMDVKYKGVPQSCVIRKPIPGYEAKEPPAERDLSPSKSPLPENSIDVPSKLLQKQPKEPEEPIKPNYTVKYRSVIDLQDFRVPRESARSLRPKEIVITIDLPLLPADKDIVLEVEKKMLLLESENPSYRLELHLSYPVDENNGKAKFNKHQRQLTVTLPVQPHSEAPQLPGGCPNPTSDPQNENQTRVEELEEGRRHVGEMAEKGGGEQSQGGNDNGAARGRRQVMEEEQKGEGEGKKVQKRNQRPEHEVKNETLPKKDDEKFELHDVQQKNKGNCSDTKEKCCRRTKDSLDSLTPTTAASPDGQKKHILTQETEKPKKAKGSVEIPTSSQESLKAPVTSAKTAVNTSDETLKRTPTKKQLEDADEDVLAAEQSFQEPERIKVPPAGGRSPREIDAAGNETVAAPHTSAGFVLQNKLMYELD